MPDQETPVSHDKDRLLKVAHRFEYYVILALVAAIGIVTLIALVRLFIGMYDAAFVSWNIKNYLAVQVLFGMIMTVLIALEFGNSILRHIRENSIIIQAREVILIGMMAVVRKVMIIDLTVVSPSLVASLGVIAVALASAYWLMR